MNARFICLTKTLPMPNTRKASGFDLCGWSDPSNLSGRVYELIKGSITGTCLSID